MCGFTTLQNVIISFVKAIDGIKQLNDWSKLYFLSISNNESVVVEYAKLQCDYLSNDYFKGYNFNFPWYIWSENYLNLIEAVRKRVDVIPMIESETFFDKNSCCLGIDNLHPTEKGHKLIAENIKKYI